MPTDARALLERLVAWYDEMPGYGSMGAIASDARALLAQPAPEPDAAFREAVRDLIASARANPNWPIEQNDLPGQHTVERLYAEREHDHLAALEQVAEATARMERGRAERQGEVYEVTTLFNEAYFRPGLFFKFYEFKPGDRVRVTKVEEGA